MENAVSKYQFEEKVDEFGIEKLENWELIALVLRKGTSKRPIDVLANSVERYFAGLTNYPDLDDLLNIEGIGMAKACQLLACIELSSRFLLKHQSVQVVRPEQAVSLLSHLKKASQEEFWILILDSQARLIQKVQLSQGLVNQTAVHPREAFRLAIMDNAVTVIFAHNHPSGDSTPSHQDLEVTKRLIAVGDLVGVQVQDHIVISRREWTSIRRFSDLWRGK